LQTVIRSSMSVLSHFVPNALVVGFADKLFHSFFHELNKAVQRDFKISWARSVVDFSRSRSTVDILAEQLRNKNPVFTQDLRWSIIVKLVAWGVPDAQDLLHKEHIVDPSDAGERAVLKAGTSVDNIQVKNSAWERFISPDNKMSAHQAAAEMEGFRWPHQEPTLVPFTEKFFQVVISIFRTKEKEFAQSFFGLLFPYDPENPKILQLSKELLSSVSKDDKQLIRLLKENIDDQERDLKCRNLVLKS